MTDRRATYVHQRPPLPVPTNMNDMRKFVQSLEEILDDIYRRYGRLKATDLDETVNETLNTALETAAKNEATAPNTSGGSSGQTIPKSQIDAWAREAAEEARRQRLIGSAFSDFVTRYVEQKIAEA